MNRSGCGMRPNTRPLASQMPATSRWAPLGLPLRRSVSVVAQHQLAGVLEPVERRLVAGAELALGVGDGQLHPLDAGEEHAAVAARRGGRPSGR